MQLMDLQQSSKAMSEHCPQSHDMQCRETSCQAAATFQALEQLEQEVRNSAPLGVLQTSKLARLSADWLVIAPTYREGILYI